MAGVGSRNGGAGDHFFAGNSRINRFLRKIGQILPGNSFTRGVAMLAGGAALGQGLVVLAFPLLTRLYTPEDFGVLAVYISILSIIGIVASFRYEAAIPLPEDDETGANLLALSLLIVLIMGCLTIFGIFTLAESIVSWTNTPALKPYLWLLPLGLLGTGVYQALNYWAIRRKAFGQVARTKLSQSLGQITTQLGLGLLTSGPIGLLLGSVVGQVGGSVTLATLAWRQDRECIRNISIHGIRVTAHRYRRFPLLSSGSTLLNSAGLYLPALFVAAFYGPQVAGWFALGQRVLGAPIYLVGTAVGQVYISVAAELNREDPAALQRLFSRTARRLFFFGLAPVGLVVLLGPQLFEWAFGTDWRTAGYYAQILAPIFLMQFVVNPLSQTVYVIERQDIQLLWDASRVAIVILVFAGANLMRMGPETTMIIYGVSMLVLYVWLFHLYKYALAKNQGVND